MPPGTEPSILRQGPIEIRALGTAYAQWNFPRWAARDRAELFWSPRHHLPIALSGIPTAVTVHDLVWRRVPETMATLGHTLERFLMPPSLRNASAIIVPSRATQRDIQEDFPDVAHKVQVIPLAAELTAAPATRPRIGRPYLLFVGTLEPRKNLGRVLEAFDQFLQAGPYPHNLVIAGAKGWKSRETLLRITARQADGRVQYIGDVDDSTLAGLYADCEFLVAPSVYEGFGLQILEAMSFGKPVVTSNISSMPEIAQGAGILVNPKSTAAIAEAMAALASDDQMRATMGALAKARSEIFSWEHTAARTLQVLESCTRGH